MKKVFLTIVLFFSFLFLTLGVAHAAIYTTDKLITVDTGKQMLYAWEGGHIVYQTPVSTGLPLSPTVKGLFRIYVKYANQPNMIGYSPYKGWYNLPNVPNVMYFYQGYGIHGAYWHNNFGHPMSNGCVNAPLAAAQWLFNFAPVGTQVLVY